MRSRISCNPPSLKPVRPAGEDCPRAVAVHQRKLSGVPWQNPEGWWKLTPSGRLWRAPLGARRWRWTPWFVAEDQLWHSNGTTSSEEASSLLKLLADGHRRQLRDRLERRAAAARQRRALKPAHPPRSCCCCGCMFTPMRTDARCCSGRCRAKLSSQKASNASCGDECG